MKISWNWMVGNFYVEDTVKVYFRGTKSQCIRFCEDNGYVWLLG